jgi:hypothetical protein
MIAAFFFYVLSSPLLSLSLTTKPGSNKAYEMICSPMAAKDFVAKQNCKYSNATLSVSRSRCVSRFSSQT